MKGRGENVLSVSWADRRNYAYCRLPRAVRIQSRTGVVDRQQLLAQEYMVLLDQLVRHGSCQLHRIRGALRCESAQVRNQRTGADVVDDDRDSVTRNRKVTITELHEQRIEDTVASPAEDCHIAPVLDERHPSS